VGGRVKVAEEDGTAVKRAGGAFLGMDTAADWTKKLLGFILLCEVTQGSLWGILTLGTICAKRVYGLASGDEIKRESNLLCRDGGQRK
jgi:hypothetical protein